VIVWNEAELRAVQSAQWVRRGLAIYGKAIAGSARGEAPRRSGAGAGSIHDETVLEGGAWTDRVSWDREHYYMGFQNSGAKHTTALHFIEHAVDRYTR